MKTDQNFILGRGETWTQRFVVTGGADATEASWHCAASPSSALEDHDLDLSTGAGGITLTTDGEDAYADLHFLAVDTEAMTLGRRHHELWVTIAGSSKRRAVGTVTVQDTLKA